MNNKILSHRTPTMNDNIRDFFARKKKSAASPKEEMVVPKFKGFNELDDPALWRVYRDSTGFEYVVVLEMSKEPGEVLEKTTESGEVIEVSEDIYSFQDSGHYILYLFQNVFYPDCFVTAGRTIYDGVLRATWHPRSTGTYPFAEAFTDFKNFFCDKTFIAWDERFDGLRATAKFGRAIATYTPPTKPPFGEMPEGRVLPLERLRGSLGDLGEVPRVIKSMRGRNKGKGRQFSVEELNETSIYEGPARVERREVMGQQQGEGNKQHKKKEARKQQLLSKIANAFDDPNPEVLRDVLWSEGKELDIEQKDEGSNGSGEKTPLDEEKETKKNQLLERIGNAFDDPDPAALKHALWEEWCHAEMGSYGA